jgi:hypothetical protein
MSRYLRKLAPLIGIFVAAGWLFVKGVTTDVSQKKTR